eukprot:TRINITY_DN2764_c0_g1_i12.p1 TRINITY_DN2764_c0_g1~~TRINITY_DN2764_c0_g1_i12.p1  ORF type:complete len:243 (+),score=69.97 TRINITY_DN2764_c0_g1_i12:716-1444(+)
MEQKLRNAQREREEQSTREAEEKAREWGLTIYLTIVFGIILFVLFWCSRKYFVYRSTWYKQYVKNQNFQQERKKLVETEKIRVHEREQMTKERQDLLQKLHEREEARQEAMVEALREYETQQKRIPSSEALEEPEKETYPKMETELEAEMDLDMKKKNGISQEKSQFSFNCSACKKKFKSVPQWNNHVVSKKHKQTARMLRGEAKEAFQRTLNEIDRTISKLDNSSPNQDRESPSEENSQSE